MKRRTLLLGALGTGGALIVGWGFMPPRSRLGQPGAHLDAATSLNGWVKVYRDGRVGVVVPRAEMGQGVHTALPMLVAEELDVPLDHVRVEPAGFDAIYGNVAMLVGGLPFHPDNQGQRGVRLAQWWVQKVGRELGLQITGGSTSVRDAWWPLRQAGAVARVLLEAAAARQWGVPVAQCRLHQGWVVHADGGSDEGSDGRKASIGALAEAALHEPPPATIQLREPSQYKLLGTAAPRLDAQAKADGSACFGLDVRQPGQLYAAVRFSPVIGDTLTAFNGDAVRRWPEVVRVSSFAGGAGAGPGVAVVARNSWTALSAVRQVQVRWQGGDHPAPSSAQIMADMRAQLDRTEGFTFYEHGQGADGLAHAARVIRADYSAPYLAHATMEPMNCTAQFSADGRLRLWAPTQAASVARDVAARVAGIDVDCVDLTVTLLGGGFGRRLESDFIAVAVQVARDAAPAPVQVFWPREEDFAHDFYRPAAVARMQAGFDAQGQPVAWVARSVSDAITPHFVERAYPAWAVPAPDKTTAEGLFDQPYEFPHRAIAHQVLRTPVPVGYWRSVGHSHNAFFTESFMDEVAHAAGVDPLRFRLDQLKAHPRHRAVLERAASAAGWGTPLAAGRARGLALHESFGSIVAQVAEVSVQDHSIRVHRVACAVDCGQVINPGIVSQQVEGGIVFGLTAALFGEITVEQGRVQQLSFAQYPMVLLRDCPQIETHLMASQAEPGGVGEIAVPPVAPAIANALFALTGQRLRSLPLRLT